MEKKGGNAEYINKLSKSRMDRKEIVNFHSKQVF